jgi:FMNH2-dependent dimethyl sulfone monooxygenase
VEKLNAYANAGLDLVLLQCSPMLGEVRRIGRDVIPRLAPMLA